MVSVLLEACLYPPFLSDFAVLSSSQAVYLRGVLEAKSALVIYPLAHFADPLQFAHPASIFTVIFLAITAVSQILCLNRGLRIYDSTLVVPVFYGVVGLIARLIASAHGCFSTPRVAS